MLAITQASILHPSEGLPLKALRARNLCLKPKLTRLLLLPGSRLTVFFGTTSGYTICWSWDGGDSRLKNEDARFRLSALSGFQT